MITFEVFESWVQYFVYNSRRKKTWKTSHNQQTNKTNKTLGKFYKFTQPKNLEDGIGMIVNQWRTEAVNIS